MVWQSIRTGAADSCRQTAKQSGLTTSVKKLYTYLQSETDRDTALLSSLWISTATSCRSNISTSDLLQSTKSWWGFKYDSTGLLLLLVCVSFTIIGLQDYSRGTKTNLSSEMLGLGKLEKSLCRLCIRVEIRGKRGQTVPVLLITGIQKSLDLLMRNVSGISGCNRYIPITSTDSTDIPHQ